MKAYYCKVVIPLFPDFLSTDEANGQKIIPMPKNCSETTAAGPCCTITPNDTSHQIRPREINKQSPFKILAWIQRHLAPLQPRQKMKMPKSPRRSPRRLWRVGWALQSIRLGYPCTSRVLCRSQRQGPNRNLGDCLDQVPAPCPNLGPAHCRLGTACPGPGLCPRHRHRGIPAPCRSQRRVPYRNPNLSDIQVLEPAWRFGPPNGRLPTSKPAQRQPPLKDFSRSYHNYCFFVFLSGHSPCHRTTLLLDKTRDGAYAFHELWQIIQKFFPQSFIHITS